MGKPVYKINILQVGDLEGVDASFLCHHYMPGNPKPAPVYAFLITGENISPILVDTGIAENVPNVMARLGMKDITSEEMKIGAQLKKFGYKPSDIKVLLHTHLHIDHAGNDYQFENAKLIFARKELMWATSGIMGGQYPPEYIKYQIDQLHTPGKMRLLDGEAEIVPGIVMEPTEGHTWGSMLIKVNTKNGVAVICGDVIYNIDLQTQNNDIFVDPQAQRQNDVEAFGDLPTGNNWNLWAAKAAVQKVVREADIILPSHDPVIVEKYGYEL